MCRTTEGLRRRDRRCWAMPLRRLRRSGTVSWSFCCPRLHSWLAPGTGLLASTRWLERRNRRLTEASARVAVLLRRWRNFSTAFSPSQTTVPTMTTQATRASTPRAVLLARKVRKFGTVCRSGRITPAVVHAIVTGRVPRRLRRRSLRRSSLGAATSAAKQADGLGRLRTPEPSPCRRTDRTSAPSTPRPCGTARGHWAGAAGTAERLRSGRKLRRR